MKQKTKWINWSGSVATLPKAIMSPSSKTQLVQQLKSSSGKIRVAGSGHSFSPLVSCDDTIISLESLPGVILNHDKHKQTAIIQAGATLKNISSKLHTLDLAFKNMGDINAQTLAGAVSTATHGTGKTLPCLSAEITALELLLASGETLSIDQRDKKLLHAAQVSLGSLGIILNAEISLRQTFKLHRKTFVRPIKHLLNEVEFLWDNHRNFEFFYLPFCSYAFAITHDEVTSPDYSDHKNNDDASLLQLKLLRDLTRWNSPLRRFLISMVAKYTKDENTVGTSWQLLASERNIRFHEMEYHLPLENAFDAFNEIRYIIEKEQRDVFFPIEVRRTAADNAWLSPFQHAPRISIAVHAYQKDDYAWFFNKVEPIFQKYNGRPHWGKLHTQNASRLAGLYPDFERFLALRKELDPKNRLLNPHLATLWGEKYSN